MLTQTGETLQLTSKNDKYHQFQYQLYHYAALGKPSLFSNHLVGIKFHESLSGKRVLDLGSGRGGGCKSHIANVDASGDAGERFRRE